MKTQIVILVCILLLFLNSACAIDPGLMMRAYGLNIDITRLINKITRAFYQPTGVGIQVRTKSSPSCLDAYADYGDNSTYAAELAVLSYRQSYDYGVAPVECDSVKSSQKWKLANGQLQSWASYTTGETICLDCTSGPEDCYIESKSCNASRIQQKFYFRVHARQLDLMASAVYFSVHSAANRKRCLTTYYSTEKGGVTYALDRCSGADEQSFYINQDYSAELAMVNSRVRVCSSDSYAPACRSPYCP